MVLPVTAEGSVAERRKGRLERIRLSIRMASSINCSSVLPSSRQANSDWSSVVRPLRNNSFSGLLFQPVCAARVRKVSA